MNIHVYEEVPQPNGEEEEFTENMKGHIYICIYTYI